MLRHMFVPSGFGLSEAVAASLTNQRSVVLVLALLVVLLPGSFVLGRILESGRSRPATVVPVRRHGGRRPVRGGHRGRRHVQPLPLLPVLRMSPW